MDRLSKVERLRALSVILDEGAPDLTGETAAKFLTAVETAAIHLHELYIKQCNEPMTAQQVGHIGDIEETLRQAFAAYGLGLYLNRDPRGNPVGILTPKTGKFNTLGGREAGWRL